MRVALAAFPPMDYRDGQLLPYKNTFFFRCAPPYALYLLASILREGDRPVEIRDWSTLDCDLPAAVLDLLGFDAVLFTCNSWNWLASMHVIEQLRARRDDQVLAVGGIHATLFGEQILREIPVDYVVRGEAENGIAPLYDLVLGREAPRNVPGLLYWNAGGIQQNPPQTPLSGEALAGLPMPAYDDLPKLAAYWLPLESSRGCVNDCIFCSVPYKRTWRPIPPETFVDRLEAHLPHLSRAFSGNFMFTDDAFSVGTKRALGIGMELERRGLDVRAAWAAHVRDLTHEDMVGQLEPYTDRVLTGAESFDAETLRRIGKRFSPNEISTSAEVVQRAGLASRVVYSFVIGFPWQTKQQIYDEVDRIANLIREYDVCALINWLLPSPGSPLWDEHQGDEHVSMREIGDVFDRWHTTCYSLSPEEVQEITSHITDIQESMSREGFASHRLQFQ